MGIFVLPPLKLDQGGRMKESIVVKLNHSLGHQPAYINSLNFLKFTAIFLQLLIRTFGSSPLFS